MTITCPHCGREGKTPTEPRPGAKVRCPGCEKQFTYEIPREFVVVEPPPGHVGPHEWPKIEPAKPLRGDAWIGAAILGGVMLAVVLVLALLAGGTSLVGGLLGWAVVGVVLASPVVLVVCLIVLLAKYVLKSTMREVDAERAER